jgi:hypothetical protein
MRHFVLGSLVAVILSLSLSVPQAGAAESRLHGIQEASIARLTYTGVMATWGSDRWWTWVHHRLEKYFGSNWSPNHKGSVPIPGTLLLFGGWVCGVGTLAHETPRSLTCRPSALDCRHYLLPCASPRTF